VCEKDLKTALDGVVEDAVAVVGADLNVASETLLGSVKLLQLLFYSSYLLVVQLCTITTALSVSAFLQFIEQNVIFNERSHL